MMAREDPSNIKHVPDPSFPQGAAGGVYNGSKHCGSGRHLRCIISQGMPECVVQTCVRVCVCAHACACNVYSRAISCPKTVPGHGKKYAYVSRRSHNTKQECAGLFRPILQ